MGRIHKSQAKSRLAPDTSGEPIFQVVTVATLVFLAYWNSIANGFVFDDQGIFLDPFVAGPGFGWGILRLAQTRPLTFLTFHWNYLASGPDPAAFHLVGIVLHAANTVMVTLLARCVLSHRWAWVIGAVFAVHPLQTQAVNYVFERATLLATFFALLTIWLFWNKRYWLSSVAFAFSLLAKEETIALPAFLVLYDLGVRRRGIDWRRYMPMFALSALAAIRLALAVRWAREPQLGFGLPGISPASYALTQCRVIWDYLRLFVMPSGLNVDHDVGLSRGLVSPPRTLIAALLLVAVICVLVWFAFRRKTAAVWGLGFFVLLSPSSSVVPAADVMFEHRMYLPILCVIIAIACLTPSLKPRVTAILSVGILAALFTGTVLRNRVWRDETSLWTDALAKSPNKARPYFQLARLRASSDPDGARQLYEKGLAIEPRNGSAHSNLGLLLLSVGDTSGSMEHLRKALAGTGDPSLVWNNIGSAELQRGNLEGGLAAFRQSLARDPCRFDARWNLIHTLSAIGETQGASLAARIPANCRFLPDQSERLRREISSLAGARGPSP